MYVGYRHQATINLGLHTGQLYLLLPDRHLMHRNSAPNIPLQE
jgi:hypothetical protein